MVLILEAPEPNVFVKEEPVPIVEAPEEVRVPTETAPLNVPVVVVRIGIAAAPVTFKLPVRVVVPATFKVVIFEVLLVKRLEVRLATVA